MPGVSSAVAAPALSGIPVTHRGLASAFVVVSGHAEDAYGPVLRSLEPGAATLVILSTLREGLQYTYPGALLGSIAAAFLVAIVAWVWFRGSVKVRSTA